MPFQKFGKRPPKNAPALRLAPLLTGVVPPHQPAVDYLAQLGGGWKMLGNDYYGDCVAVTWANLRRLMTGLGGHESYPSIDEVYEVYKTQNPGFVPNPNDPVEDNGMDIQTLLEHLVKVGGPDGVKALAFAKVDGSNLDEVKSAIEIFRSLWTGMTVLQANETEFDQGKPWDDVPGSPVAGGHSVAMGGFTATTSDDGKMITWAKEVGLTDRFIANDVDELWVVIWPEHLNDPAFVAGIDLAQLAADYTALTGRPFPVVPTPGPAPAPVPVPTPVADADTTLANATRVWASARHRGANRLAALAVQAWLKAKGL